MGGIRQLYNDDRGDQPEIKDDKTDKGEILISEIWKVREDLETGRASGSDMMETEMVKTLDNKGIDFPKLS